MTGQLVAVIGVGVLPPDALIVSADDVGLVRGDGCFDATRIVVDGERRTVDHLDRHLERFAASSAAMDLPPLDHAAWAALVAAALAAWDTEGEAVLKLVRTRGLEHGGHAATEFFTITAVDPALLVARAGIAVISLARGYGSNAFAAAPWLLGGVKTLSYAVNSAAKRLAQRQGADDALFVSSDGFALEGPTSALIARFGDRLVTTPVGATGILASVTQEVVFAAARAHGLSTAAQLLTLAQVREADGAWLASSIRGVCPILTLDGQPLRHDAGWSARLSEWGGFGSGTPDD